MWIHTSVNSISEQTSFFYFEWNNMFVGFKGTGFKLPNNAVTYSGQSTMLNILLMFAQDYVHSILDSIQILQGSSKNRAACSTVLAVKTTKTLTESQ